MFVLLCFMTLLTEILTCSCQILPSPLNVDDNNLCYARYKVLGFMSENPFGKMISVQAGGDKCGSYSFAGNTVAYQNFSFTMNCTKQAGHGDNSISLNASISYKSGT